MKKIAVYAGSFDPLTNGHSWIIERAQALFDEVIVAVAHNPSKHYTFSAETRSQLVAQSHPGVKLAVIPGEYLVKYAKANGATHLVRGIRSTADFEYEKTICNVNRSLLDPDIETVFLIPPKEIEDISSSFVKGLVGPYGWNHVVNKLVPPAVFRALQRDYLQQRTDHHPDLDGVINEMSAPWRSYHNLNHLIDMFASLDAADLESPDGIVEAILKHDLFDERDDSPSAVERSAQAAANPAAQALIRATVHGYAKTRTPAEKLMTDLDLAVLGSDWYEEYAAAIYDEYVTHGHVTPEHFKIGRKAVLEKFLSAPIYHTPEFSTRYESRARANITQELSQLSFEITRGFPV